MAFDDKLYRYFTKTKYTDLCLSRGPFKGNNFITPHKYIQGKFPNGVYFEVSYGESILDEGKRLYGLTLHTGKIMDAKLIDEIESLQGASTDEEEIINLLESVRKLK